MYHWTISTGFSLAEASNLYVGPLHSMLPHMHHWSALIHAACAQVSFLSFAVTCQATLLKGRHLPKFSDCVLCPDLLLQSSLLCVSGCHVLYVAEACDCSVQIWCCVYAQAWGNCVYQLQTSV